VRLTLEAIPRADLVIFLLDASRPFDDDDRQILAALVDKRFLAVCNKADLKAVIRFPEELAARGAMAISTRTGEGIDMLKDAVTSSFLHGHAVDSREYVALSRARHRDALVKSAAALIRFSANQSAGLPPEILAIDLRDALAAELGMQHDWPVVIVGGGNLGLALAGYAGFAARGFRVVGLVDADRLRIGESVGDGLVVQPMDDLSKIVRRTHCVIGVIATPVQSAQEVADELIASGVTGILNFAPTVLSVPSGVQVRDVDLGVELQLLAFHEQQRTLAGDGVGEGE